MPHCHARMMFSFVCLFRLHRLRPCLAGVLPRWRRYTTCTRPLPLTPPRPHRRHRRHRGTTRTRRGHTFRASAECTRRNLRVNFRRHSTFSTLARPRSPRPPQPHRYCLRPIISRAFTSSAPCCRTFDRRRRFDSSRTRCEGPTSDAKPTRHHHLHRHQQTHHQHRPCRSRSRDRPPSMRIWPLHFCARGSLTASMR